MFMHDAERLGLRVADRTSMRSSRAGRRTFANRPERRTARGLTTATGHPVTPLTRPHATAVYDRDDTPRDSLDAGSGAEGGTGERSVGETECAPRPPPAPDAQGGDRSAARRRVRRAPLRERYASGHPAPEGRHG